VSKKGNAEKTLWTSKLSLEWEHKREFQIRQGSLSKRANAEIVCVSKMENAEKTLWTSKLSLEWEQE
jgi:uncharacterized coiled-coil DUF342 family protein